MTLKTDYHNDNDTWMLYEDLLHPADTRLSETLFSQGNGFIGIRGTPEEGWQPDFAPTFEGIYLNGYCVQESLAHQDSSLCNAAQFEQQLHVPNVKNIQVSIGQNDKIISHERQLDLRTGIVSRQKLLELPDKKQCLVEFERFVSAANPNLMCIRVECLALSDNVMLEIKTGSDEGYAVSTSVSRLKGRSYTVKDMLHLLSAEQNDDFARFIHEIKNSSTKLATTCIDMVNVPGSLSESQNNALNQQHSYINVAKHIRLPAGKSAVFYRYALFHGHDNVQALKQLSQSAINSLLDVTYATLKRQHCDVMTQYWQGAQQSVILCEPHASLLQQQGLNFGMLQLFQTAGRTLGSGFPSRGLSGPAGDGHMSWESDIHGLPYFALAAPALARQLLVTRYHQLPHARARARDLSYEHGALYPCLTISGEESSVNALRASTQLHVNGAIAYAIKQYYRATGDTDFIRDYGAEMLVEMARLWQQSGYFNPHIGDKFCIDGVSGVNEFRGWNEGDEEAPVLRDSNQGNSHLVNNHFYTNFLAKTHLLLAIEVMTLLQQSNKKAYAKLCMALQFDAFELANWQVIADKMYLPTDTAQRIHAQDNAFFDQVAHYQKNRPQQDLQQQAPQGNENEEPNPGGNSTGKIASSGFHNSLLLPQSDVLLAMVLADEAFDVAQKQRNLDYYLSFTNHHGEMSRLVCCILLCESGRVDEAKTFLGRAARTDLDNRLNNSQEGLHCLTMAGTYNAIVYGFLGVRLRKKGFFLAPQLPAGWAKITQNIHYKQRIIQIYATVNQVDITLLKGDPITVYLCDQPVHLDMSQAPLSAASKAPQDSQPIAE